MSDSKLVADRLIQRLHSFPSLPTVVTRVLEVTSDPRSSVLDLKKIIEADSSLAMEVLKLSNSPFFGLRRRVATLEHGISLLGMAEIKNLVLAKSMFQTFRSTSGSDISRLWQHSFYSGLAARVIAPRLSLDANECFVAGLIHDVGKLIIYSEIDDDKVIRLEHQAPSTSILEEEKAAIGISHDRLGQLLLSKWMFPSRLVHAVGFHHHPGDAMEHKVFALVIYIANILTHLNRAINNGNQDDETQNDKTQDQKTQDQNTRTNSLKQMLLNPAITQMAAEFNLTLNESTIETFLEELHNEIQNEAEITSLLENGTNHTKK